MPIKIPSINQIIPDYQQQKISKQIENRLNNMSLFNRQTLVPENRKYDAIEQIMNSTHAILKNNSYQTKRNSKMVIQTHIDEIHNKPSSYINENENSTHARFHKTS